MHLNDWYATGKRINIDGLNVFYQLAGQGETLVCIHGFPTSSWDFAPIWPALTDRFKVLALDLIGLGGSAKNSASITINLQADMVEKLACDQGIKSAHILAHDLGDTVAQELLARQADGTSKIDWLSCVFLNGGIFPEAHSPRLIQKLLASPIGPIIARFSSKRIFSKTMTNIFAPSTPPSEQFIDGSWRLLLQNNGRAALPKLIGYMRERRINRARWISVLVDSKIPLRLINGIADPISGQQMVDRFAELVSDADIVRLEQIGHYPHIESPQQVLRALFEFHDSL